MDSKHICSILSWVLLAFSWILIALGKKNKNNHIVGIILSSISLGIQIARLIFAFS